MMKWSCLVLIGCMVASCANKVAYEAPVFVEKKPKEIKILNDEYMFRHGGNPMLADSLLIVSTLVDEHHIAVFNRYTGNLLTSGVFESIVHNTSDGMPTNIRPSSLAGA